MKGYVLVVDDDEDTRVLLGAVLDGLGLRHEFASDGIEALAQIESDPPKLIMLDLMMPGMQGYDVVYHLRANPATREIPVVVFTAHKPSQEDMHKLPGVAEVIRKGSDIALEQVEVIAMAVLNHTGLDHLTKRRAQLN